MCKKTFNTGCLFDPYATLLYLSVSTRTAIGQFFGPYFTERTAKFEKPWICFAAVVLYIEEIVG